MTDTAISFQVFNLVLMVAAGICLAVSRKGERHRVIWISILALSFMISIQFAIVAALGLFGATGMESWPEYWIFTTRRTIWYLLLIWIAVKSREKLDGVSPLWVWPALFLVIIAANPLATRFAVSDFTAFISMSPEVAAYFIRNIPYYLPRVILYIGLAGMLRKSIRNKEHPITAIALMAVYEISSDILKMFISEPEILVMQFVYDHGGIFILASGILIVAVAELLKHRPVVKSALSPRPELTLDFIEHARFRKSITAVYNRLDEAEKSIDTLNFIAQALAVKHIKQLGDKDFMTHWEAGLYLSLDPDDAKEFLNHNGVAILEIAGDKGPWMVRKQDLLDALSRASLKSRG